MTETKNRGKWQPIIMVGMVVGVLLAGFLIFPKTEEDRAALLDRLGTTNQGQLLMSPLQIDGLSLLTMEAEPWNLSEQKLKWRMLIMGDGACVEDCKEMLYLTNQVHLLLGKKSHRFERIYLTTTDGLQDELIARIDQNHHYLKVLKVKQVQLDQWLQSDELSSSSPYGMALLVDQKGVVMMRYGPEHNGGGMLEDIKHLLRYSPTK